MFFHRDQQFSIYFGGIADEIDKEKDCIPSSIPLKENPLFKPVVSQLHLADLGFLNQTHSIEGSVITTEIPAFNNDGDYLITERKNLGIGVMTADCLPIIFIDTRKQIIAIAHAGWRGTVAGIASVVVKRLQAEFKSDPAHIQAFFGPCAKNCCYEVDEGFCKNLDENSKKIIIKRNSRSYFDLVALNCLRLMDAGLPKSAFNFNYSYCTICDLRFFSHRRQAEKAGRQMTIVCLQ